MASLLGQSLRKLALGSRSTAVTASSSSRTLTTSAPVLAAAPKKAAPLKKKSVSAVKKAGSGGPRGSKQYKSPTDFSASVSKTNEFLSEKPDMSHLPLLHAENMTLDSVGQTFAYTDKVLTAFKVFGLPQNLERELALHPKPRTLLRNQTLQMIKTLDKHNKQSTSETILLQGKTGSGKSVLMAQSIAHAVEEGWIVISIPRAIKLINSSTMFTYSPQHLAYLQPEATKALLDNISKINQGALKDIKLAKEVSVDNKTLGAETGLDAVLKLAIAPSTSPAATQTLFEATITAITSQTNKPVLIAVDDVQALFRTSKYVNPDCKALQAYELGLPRALLALFAQSGAFQVKKGVVMGAVSTTHTEYPTPPELELAFARAKGVVLANPVVNPYTKLQDIHLQHADKIVSGANVIDTSEPLSKAEAASLLTQLRQEKVLWTAVNDEFFLAKLIETNGNPRLFSKSLTATLL